MLANENNRITLVGVVESIRDSHETAGEKFYLMTVSSHRTSDVSDYLECIIPAITLETEAVSVGDTIEIQGTIRTYNAHDENGRSHLKVYVFVDNIRIARECEEHKNYVELIGYICKTPIERTTPLGRVIADVSLAVNRPYGKSDYIPCIAWSRNASRLGALEVGDKIKAYGRFQSREYNKIINNEQVRKICYEVSIGSLEVLGKRLRHVEED